ncbi:hypothetical protein VQ7734_00305 [Vibrio quintilis]|uniref:Uncharacterized protein n=1 Tax=Vibrio quintilis TaxID=1117707 RepID=A0A1M7YPQ0_9VIBR|nr:hypothetical protein VQ7734_00305 [Vibrio quintilis]
MKSSDKNDTKRIFSAFNHLISKDFSVINFAIFI